MPKSQPLDRSNSGKWKATTRRGVRYFRSKSDAQRYLYGSGGGSIKHIDSAKTGFRHISMPRRRRRRALGV